MPTVTQQTVIEEIIPLAPDVRGDRAAQPRGADPVPSWAVGIAAPARGRTAAPGTCLLAGPPEEPGGSLTLCLDRVEGGLGSGYLFEREVGDRIVVGEALGNLVLPEPLEQGILFVARLHRHRPFRCMLLAFEGQPLPCRVRLVYGAPNRRS